MTPPVNNVGSTPPSNNAESPPPSGGIEMLPPDNNAEKCVKSIDIRDVYSVYPLNLSRDLKRMSELGITAKGNSDPNPLAMYKEEKADLAEIFDGTDLKFDPVTGMITSKATGEETSLSKLEDEAQVVFRDPDRNHDGVMTEDEFKSNVLRKFGPTKGAGIAVYSCEVLKAYKNILETRYRPMAQNLQKFKTKVVWKQIFRLLETYRTGTLIAELNEANLETPVHGIGIWTKTLPNVALFLPKLLAKIKWHDTPLLQADAWAMERAREEFDEVGKHLEKLKKVVEAGIAHNQAWATQVDLNGALAQLRKDGNGDTVELLEDKLALSRQYKLLTNIYNKTDKVKSNEPVAKAFQQFQASLAPLKDEALTSSQIQDLLTYSSEKADKTDQVKVKDVLKLFFTGVKLQTDKSDKLPASRISALAQDFYEKMDKTDKSALKDAIIELAQFARDERHGTLGFGGGNTTHRSPTNVSGRVNNLYYFRTVLAELEANFSTYNLKDTDELREAFAASREDSMGDGDDGPYNVAAWALTGAACDVLGPAIGLTHVVDLLTLNHYEVDTCKGTPRRAWKDEAWIALPGDAFSLGLAYQQGFLKTNKWGQARAVFREEKGLRNLFNVWGKAVSAPSEWKRLTRLPGRWNLLRYLAPLGLPLYGRNLYGGKPLAAAAAEAVVRAEKKAKELEAAGLSAKRWFGGRWWDATKDWVSGFVQGKLPKLSPENEAYVRAMAAAAAKPTKKGLYWLYKFLLITGLSERWHDWTNHFEDLPFHERSDPYNNNSDVGLAPHSDPTLPDPQWNHPQVDKPPAAPPPNS